MYLKDKLVYLGGPIDLCTAKVDWRPPVRAYLKDIFGIKVHDPFTDEKQIQAGPLAEAKAVKDYDKVAQIAAGFVRKDLAMVDRSDFIIANLPYKVPTYGTTEEIITAWRSKKPVLLVCEDGKDKLPSWFFGYIPHSLMFGSWQELYDYLHAVDDGLHKGNSRWAMVYGLI